MPHHFLPFHVPSYFVLPHFVLPSLSCLILSSRFVKLKSVLLLLLAKPQWVSKLKAKIREEDWALMAGIVSVLQVIVVLNFVARWRLTSLQNANNSAGRERETFNNPFLKPILSLRLCHGQTVFENKIANYFLFTISYSFSQKRSKLQLIVQTESGVELGIEPFLSSASWHFILGNSYTGAIVRLWDGLFVAIFWQGGGLRMRIVMA